MLASRCRISRSEDLCCFCGVTDPEKLTFCDGSVFPGVGPNAIKCERNKACADCRLSTLYFKEHWLCDDCLEESNSMHSLCGYDLRTPRDDKLVSQNVRPLALPVPFPQPEDTEREERNASKCHDDRNENSTIFCGALCDYFAQHNTSIDAKTALVDLIHKMENKGVLHLNAALPRDVRTVMKQGSTLNLNDNVKAISIDSAALGQGQSFATLLVWDVVEAIQSALLDMNIPPEAYYFGRGEALKSPTGQRVYGGELWNNLAWERHGKSIKSDGFLLAIFIAGDGVAVTGGSAHPYYMMVGNVLRAFRHHTSRIFAFFPDVLIRRPHGSKTSERLNDEQKKSKAQLCNDSHASIFAPLEWLAEHGHSFFVRRADGSIVKLLLYPRVFAIPADLLEKFSLTCVNMPHCPRCHEDPCNFGSSSAENVCGRNEARGRRTLAQTIALQHGLLRWRNITGLSTKARKMASSLGMNRFEVMNQFFWFSALFDRKYGIFEAMHYDDLHMFKLGWIPRLLEGLDNAFWRYHKTGTTLRSREDVRHLVEDIMKQIPAMKDEVHRLPTFDKGWWVMEAWNGVNYESMLSLILLVFTTHDGLVEDEGVRMALANVVILSFTFYRNLKMKELWTDAEVESLIVDIRRMIKEATHVFSLTQVSRLHATISIPDALKAFRDKSVKNNDKVRHDDAEEEKEEEEGDEEKNDDVIVVVNEKEKKAIDAGGPLIPRNGIRTLKTHSLSQAGYAIKSFGSTSCVDSGAYEVCHRPVKEAFLFGTHQNDITAKRRTLVRLIQQEKQMATKKTNVRTEREKRYFDTTAKSHDLQATKQRSTKRRESNVAQDASVRTKELLSSIFNNADGMLDAVNRLLQNTRGSCITLRLKLPRTIETAGLELNAGHHLQLRDERVCLLVAVVSTEDESRGAVLPLELHPSGVNGRHPVNRLRWLRRLPLTDIELVSVSTIRFRVHVVPAFTFHGGTIGEDGFLVNHGIFNYHARHLVSHEPSASARI